MEEANRSAHEDALPRRVTHTVAGNVVWLPSVPHCSRLDSRQQSPNYSVGFVPSELMVGRVIARLGDGGA
jgi:hypothetical protein